MDLLGQHEPLRGQPGGAREQQAVLADVRARVTRRPEIQRGALSHAHPTRAEGEAVPEGEAPGDEEECAVHHRSGDYPSGRVPGPGRLMPRGWSARGAGCSPRDWGAGFLDAEEDGAARLGVLEHAREIVGRGDLLPACLGDHHSRRKLGRVGRRARLHLGDDRAPGGQPVRFRGARDRCSGASARCAGGCSRPSGSCFRPAEGRAHRPACPARRAGRSRVTFTSWGLPPRMTPRLTVAPGGRSATVRDRAELLSTFFPSSRPPRRRT